MKVVYKIRPYHRHIPIGILTKVDNGYEVVSTTTIFGDRTTAYDSEPDSKSEKTEFSGSLSDCYCYIKAKQEGLM